MKEKDSKKSSKKDRDAKVKERGKLKRKDYEKQLRKLQAELCAVQEWVKATGRCWIPEKF